MLRYKHFSGPAAEMEMLVNGWLAEYEPDVTQMVQTVAPDGSIVISFLFEESFRGQERRFESERHLPAAAPAASLPDDPIIVPVEPEQVNTIPGTPAGNATGSTIRG